MFEDPRDPRADAANGFLIPVEQEGMLLVTYFVSVQAAQRQSSEHWVLRVQTALGREFTLRDMTWPTSEEATAYGRQLAEVIQVHLQARQGQVN